MTTLRSPRKYGWHPSLPDYRDQRLTHTALKMSHRPPHFSLVDKMPPVWDQSELGSCSAQSSGAAFEYELQLQKCPIFRPSRLFIYYNARKLEGTTDSDSGAELRDVIKGLATYGSPPEVEWPYNEQAFNRAPSEACYQHGKKHLVTKYLALRQSVADICTTIADGRPVIFGFSVYSGFESEETAKTGILKLPEPDEELVGGHAVLAVGYSDATRYITVRNSWGANWGQKGYFQMPYAYIESPSLASDFWVIQSEMGDVVA